MLHLDIRTRCLSRVMHRGKADQLIETGSKKNIRVILLIRPHVPVGQVVIGHALRPKREEIADYQNPSIAQHPVYFGDGTQQLAAVNPMQHEIHNNTIELHVVRQRKPGGRATEEPHIRMACAPVFDGFFRRLDRRDTTLATVVKLLKPVPIAGANFENILGNGGQLFQRLEHRIDGQPMVILQRRFVANEPAVTFAPGKYFVLYHNSSPTQPPTPDDALWPLL